MAKCDILKYSSSKWVLENGDYPSDLSQIERCYIFLNKNSYPETERNLPKSERGHTKKERDDNRKERERKRGEFLSSFKVPDFLKNDTCTDLNGYFGCSGEYDEKEKLESYSTWFRCLVKMVKDEEKGASKGYKWYEMGVFTRWCRSGPCIVLCIDTPENLRLQLNEVLQKPSPPPDKNDPFAMHSPLIDQMVELYDKSVWASRDPIRKIEKERKTAKPDFEIMHEISRHAVHISEVLSASIEVIKNLQRQQKAIYSSLPDLSRSRREQAQEYTHFQLEMLKSLKLRADSNYERLKSEITLAFNMLAQQDNNVMKSIGLLTMTFLPATFISALFSTTFFTFGEDGWEMSHRVWVYWVITLPLTLLVIVFWRLWLNGTLSHAWKDFLATVRPSALRKRSPTELESKADPPSTPRLGWPLWGRKPRKVDPLP